MRVVGELSLLCAFVTSGFGAFACVVGSRPGRRGISKAGVLAAMASMLALTLVACILAWALVTKDFGFAYVAHYSSQLLPWHYSLSALWVGQAGSLLLWAWLSAAIGMLFLTLPGHQRGEAKSLAFGVLMGYVFFLIGVMVFSADPMEASLSIPRDGVGLSPLLQHPAMLLHPPIIFLGYALWTIPFALAVVALASGQRDDGWVRSARPWAVAAWAVLGGGILLGADWAYEELGWGGYWGWDPVENGSLIPWLTGTALLHVMMAWQYRGVFKRTGLALALATFGLCNFATFLTRSGIFSSLHAFSASPIGWLFLILMLSLLAGGALGLIYHRASLKPDRAIQSVFSREALVLMSVVAILLLTAVTITGTLSSAISTLVLGRTVMMGPAFYNHVLVPTGLVLLATMAVVPLLRWGTPPADSQRKGLAVCFLIGVIAMFAAWAGGLRHPIEIGVIGLAMVAVTAAAAALLLTSRHRTPGQPWFGLWVTLRIRRREYTGFVMHLAFICLALGVTGSSLGTRQQRLEMTQGDVVCWSGYDIRLEQLRQRDLADKLIGEAVLRISRGGRVCATLLPARHFHLRQGEWTTEVAIHSTWRKDLYVILHSGDERGTARMTLVENPWMRWLWLSGWIMGLGVCLRLWPARRAARAEMAAPQPIRNYQSAPSVRAKEAA